MDGSQSPPILHGRARAHRVRGPRPCSWMSSSSDSSSGEHRDAWSWAVQRPSLRRGTTLRSSTPSDVSESVLSSPSSSPLCTPNSLVEFGDRAYSRHAHRRKPMGPRASRGSSSFDVRPSLLITTSLPGIQREKASTIPADILESAQIVHSPSDFLLDWDAIFEVLGCSEAFPDDDADSYQS